MNSIVTNSPPIKDENYAKTASLLRVLSAASNGSQTPNSEDKNSGLLSDINANDQKDFSANRGAYIPFHGNYDVSIEKFKNWPKVCKKMRQNLTEITSKFDRIWPKMQIWSKKGRKLA